MVAVAHVLIDAVFHPLNPLPALQPGGSPGFDPALAFQLAFALGDDDFQAVEVAGQRLLQGAAHGVHLVGVRGAQPLQTHALERVLDRLVLVHQALVQVGMLQGVGLGRIVGRVEDVLRAGGRGVAVLHDQQHRVVAVEQRGLHASEQAVVPEAAVAHDGQAAPLHHRRDPGAAGQAHAIAQDRMAGRERFEGGQGVTADVGGDVDRADLLLRQLQGREHRPLRAADAKGRWPGRQHADLADHRRAPGVVAGQPCLGPRQFELWQVLLGKRQQAARHHFHRVFTSHRQHVFAMHGGLHVGAAQRQHDVFFDVLRVALFDHQHRALGHAKTRHLARHQRVSDVEHQQRHGADAKGIGQAELLHRPQQRVVQAALDDDADAVVG